MTDPTPLRLALLSRQVLHYHAPRFAAAGRRLGAGLDVLALANEGKFAQALSEVPATDYRLTRIYPDLDSYRAAARDRRLAGDLTRMLDFINPTVIAIAGWASPECYAAIVWAKRHDARIVVMSDSRAEDAARNGLREWIKGRLVRLCDAGLVAGGPHRTYLTGLGLDSDRIFDGYDVVDNAYFAQGADRVRAGQAPGLTGLPDADPGYLLACARYVPKKNLSRLIAAYGQAAAHGPLPDLVIAGDGEGRGDLQNLIVTTGLTGRVHLHGYVGYRDLPALYAGACGFIHVPLYEQWGLVVNEAAAAGLPMVVSASCGAASELLDEGRTGWPVPATDTDAIAAAIARLAGLAPAARAQMATAARARVADWSPDRFARHLEAAARAAQTATPRRLGLIDRLIMRQLGQRPIEDVG